MPQHVHATHRIHLGLPPADCLRLFTPAGEERWVDGWRPRYLPPGNGRTEAGMVFTTGAGAELTIWCLTEFDADASLVRYARVTPASRAGTVEVRCRPAPGGGSDVQVTYRLAALSEAGVEDLRAYEAEAFARMIDGWKQRIESMLPGAAGGADPLTRRPANAAPARRGTRLFGP